MKKISVLIPCFNEEQNVVPISEAIHQLFQNELSCYNYELVFIDNDSTDNTRSLLRMICKKNHKIKAIFNAKNFGQFNSPYYGMLQTTGDCTITMVCDFQDPIEMIPQFIQEWENGYKIVIGIKTSSKESKLMYGLRSIYYKLIKKFSNVEQIEHFTGFGLYDKSFVQVLRDLKDPTPFIRGIVAELGTASTQHRTRRARASGTVNLSLADILIPNFATIPKFSDGESLCEQENASS